jgi:hypothetical protein
VGAVRSACGVRISVHQSGDVDGGRPLTETSRRFAGPGESMLTSGVLESAQYLNEVSHQAGITVIKQAACASHCESINKQDP